MKKYYFSFGHGQAHHVNGITWDLNLLCVIEAEDHETARQAMNDTFGTKWSMDYGTKRPDMIHWPRGEKVL